MSTLHELYNRYSSLFETGGNIINRQTTDTIEKEADVFNEILDMKSYAQAVYEILKKYLEKWGNERERDAVCDILGDDEYTYWLFEKPQYSGIDTNFKYDYENFLRAYAQKHAIDARDWLLQHIKGGQYHVSGNFAMLDYDFEKTHHSFDFEKDVRQKILNNEYDDIVKEFSRWAVDWLFHRNGSFGITYDFGELLSELYEDYWGNEEDDYDE